MCARNAAVVLFTTGIQNNKRNVLRRYFRFCTATKTTECILAFIISFSCEDTFSGLRVLSDFFLI